MPIAAAVVLVAMDMPIETDGLRVVFCIRSLPLCNVLPGGLSSANSVSELVSTVDGHISGLE